jgi:predicted DsbA family dithiol-disulfide isomerase
MRISLTYYLDVVSSWCFWSEPAWAELKKRYDGKVQFQWKIALMDKGGLPVSRKQEEWFYRRSGTLMRSPFMLRSDWYDEPIRAEYLAPNCVAEAAKEFGATDDRVRLALSHAALRDGKRVGEWEIAAEVAAEAGKIDDRKFLERAKSSEVEQRVRKSTAEFHALQVTQRPTFVLDTEIGDRAVFSGLAKAASLITALDAMLDDAEAYESYAAHFGAPPSA